ncbi:MAG: transporter substrate-binding domain-containing protein [Roseibium sp.]
MTRTFAGAFIGPIAICFVAYLALALAPANALEPGLSDGLEEALREPFEGDFDEMIERGMLRVLIPFSKTFYFIDNGVQRGTTVEMMTQLGKYLDKRHGKKVRDGDIIMIPTPREKLLSELAAGRGDIALGNITATPERQKIVSFSNPVISDVREVPLTAKGSASIASPEGLSGLEVHVRESSSYFSSLVALNEKLAAAGKDPVNIVKVNDRMEDEDLLEMVQAGGISTIIIDQHKAEFWMQVLDGLMIHPDAAVRSDADVAIAVRKNAPKLLQEINGFTETVKKGTLLGNIILKRYLKDVTFLKNLEDQKRKEHFDKVAELFYKYGEEYSIDWLLVAALSYQESQFRQEVRSHAGAVGLMQIKPTTAAGNPINIGGVAKDPDKNVHAGVKYLRYLADQYFPDLKDDPANQTFFAMGAYNAGPSRFARLRKEAEKQGYNPDEWFGNVEWIVAKRISRETFHYVSNIYKYYVVFAKEAERYQLDQKAAPQK